MQDEKTIRQGISIIKAKTGINLTEEQEDVVLNFKGSMSVFANPGTGKTTTAVAGLIAAQTLHGISGKKINAMSFTKLATAELSARYKKACRQCGITANVNFNTFHSICYKIIRKVYPNFSIRSFNSIATELKYFQEYVKNAGVKQYEDMYLVKRIYKAMTDLGGELLFSEESVSSSAKFIDISDSVTLEQFQDIRSKWFKRNFVSQSMTQGEIPMMVLFTLLINPKLIDEIRKEYELMIVDEFQDMSVLYLEILSMISKELIVIGDLKQQIYGFNGASLLIQEAYINKYPNAPILELTQSFRCNNEVVKLANSVISRNDIKGYLNFKGNGYGGNVTITENSSDIFNNIVEEIKRLQDNKEYIDVMFLARNNSSVIPIIEQLYKRDIIFRTTKLSTVMDLPIFKELCLIADVALNPRDPDKVEQINKFFPEFRRVPASQNPILEVMKISPRESDKSLLTVNYRFKEDSSIIIINRMNRFVDLNSQGAPFSVSLEPLLQIYSDYIIEDKWWKLENSKEYYFNLVESIISNKTYNEMIVDENDKYNKNKYYSELNEGVRCYTFHSSKGLEAERVFLLDVDEGLVPKSKQMKDLIDKGCLLEAARELRNERNLLYVAITRCKKDLHIVYNEALAELVNNPDNNGYNFLDTIWKEKAVIKDETSSFKEVMGVSHL